MRSETNAIRRSSAMLPRSRCLIQSARFRSSMRRSVLGVTECQAAAGHGSTVAAYGEANQVFFGKVMLQAQAVSRPHDIEKLDRCDVPAGQIDAALAFDELQRLIQERRARQDGELGEMTGEGRMVRRDGERAVRDVGDG